MMVVFRSLSLAVQILVRERLEAQCEEFEVPNWQQTSYFDNPEKAPACRGRDAAVVVQEQGRTGDGAGTPTSGGSASARAVRPPGWKRFHAEEMKELVMERNIPIGPDG